MSPAYLNKLVGTKNKHHRANHAQAQLNLECLEARLALATLAVPSALYPTITAAEAAATPGDKIKVAAGDYRSEGVIVVNVARLEIEGFQHDKDPTKGNRTTGGKNESTVTGFDLQADKIEIEGFTVNNSGGDGIATAPDHSGYEIEDNIFSGNSGAAIVLRSNGTYKTEVEENWFNNSVGAPLQGNLFVPPPAGFGPNGWDIRNFGFGSGPLSNAEIEDNKFSEPTQFGSAVDLEGGKDKTAFTKITIEENDFEHSNGIILWGAADSRISENEMPYYAGTGISLKNFINNVKVEDNDLYAGVDSGDGIRVENTFAQLTLPPTPNLKIEENTIAGIMNGKAGGFGADGIDVIGTDKGFVTRIKDNKITHMGHDGIRLRDGVFGALVLDNDIFFCGNNGITLDGAHNNTVKENKSNDNAADGIHVQNSTGNLVKENSTRRNDIGIRVTSNATGNTFDRNKSFDNVTLDYRDASAPGGTGPDGVQNTWTKNKGNTANPAGLIN